MRGELNLAEAHGLIGWILEWAILVLGWASVIFFLLFPIACLISWTLILGSRVGWWRLPDEREGAE